MIILSAYHQTENSFYFTFITQYYVYSDSNNIIIILPPNCFIVSFTSFEIHLCEEIPKSALEFFTVDKTLAVHPSGVLLVHQKIEMSRWRWSHFLSFTSSDPAPSHRPTHPCTTLRDTKMTLSKFTIKARSSFPLPDLPLFSFLILHSNGLPLCAFLAPVPNPKVLCQRTTRVVIGPPSPESSNTGIVLHSADPESILCLSLAFSVLVWPFSALSFPDPHHTMSQSPL